MSKFCPHCNCNTAIKYGIQNGCQRYKCKQCGKTWQNKRRQQKMQNLLWYDYAIEDLRLDQLSNKYHYGKDKIRKILMHYEVQSIAPSGSHDVIGIDCTYFGRRSIDEWGLLIIIDLHTGECLYCEELPGHETYAHYYHALKTLNMHGVFPKACVIDGTPGVTSVLRNACILTQYCQFHQIKAIHKYLTRSPVLEPNIKLRELVLALTHIDRQTFINCFNVWLAKYQSWLNEKTRNPETSKLEYAHKKTRSAVNSIERNLPYLFTYQQYPMFQIPNTNNKLEGINSALKSKLIHHRGTKKALKTKIIRSFLSRRTGV